MNSKMAKTLTPALSRPMGEGEPLDALIHIAPHDEMQEWSLILTMGDQQSFSGSLASPVVMMHQLFFGSRSNCWAAASLSFCDRMALCC